MPDNKTPKTVKHPKKKEIIQTPDETIIDSKDASELESFENVTDSKQSIYQELLNLGYNSDNSSLHILGVLSVLLISGLMIGGLVGIYESTMRKQEVSKMVQQQSMQQASQVQSNFQLATTGATTEKDKIDCTVVQGDLPSQGIQDTNTAPILSKTGGISSLTPTKADPVESNSDVLSPSTAPQPKTTNDSTNQKKSTKSQFQVVENTDGSYTIVW